MIDNTILTQIQKSYTKKEASRSVLVGLAEKTEKELMQLDSYIINSEKARVVFQEVAKQTQQNMEKHLSNIVTLSLTSVFEKPPEFIVRFENKRGKTECQLLFKENGTEYKPIEGSGGGLLDITSFALRITFWALNKTSSTFILDEPFSNVSPNYHEKVGAMVKMISEKLNIQIIMVSHSETINYHADKTYSITKNKYSEVTELT